MLGSGRLTDHIDHRPRVVVDVHGNLWQHYGDVGYVMLMTAPKTMQPAQPTLAALNEYVGPVREVVIPNG